MRIVSFQVETNTIKANYMPFNDTLANWIVTSQTRPIELDETFPKRLLT